MLIDGPADQAALWLAESDDVERDLADTMAALSGMLESLCVSEL